MLIACGSHSQRRTVFVFNPFAVRWGLIDSSGFLYLFQVCVEFVDRYSWFWGWVPIRVQYPVASAGDGHYGSHKSHDTGADVTSADIYRCWHKPWRITRSRRIGTNCSALNSLLAYHRSGSIPILDDDLSDSDIILLFPERTPLQSIAVYTAIRVPNRQIHVLTCICFHFVQIAFLIYWPVTSRSPGRFGK